MVAMSSALYPLLAALLVMFISLSGVLFSAVALQSWMQRNLTYLASFAGGVFLLVVYHLFEETAHAGSFALASGAVLFGGALMFALQRLMPAHHHHETAHDHAHTHIDGRRVLLSDAFHNIGDGLLLVAAFAVDVWVGFAAAIGIVLHELVQEISEFFILKEAGYSNAQALTRNFMTSATILIGIAVATFLASAETIAILFAGIAAGGFVVILGVDLVPHAMHSIRRDGGAWRHGAAFVLGIALMFAVQTWFPAEDHADAFATAPSNTSSASSR